MKEPDSSLSALQRMVKAMKAEGADVPTFMRKIQQALTSPGEHPEGDQAQLTEQFDAAVAEVLRWRRASHLRAPAAKPKSARQAEAEWKKLEAELEQELKRKFNL